MWNGEGAGCSSSSKEEENGSRKREREEDDEVITLQEVIDIDQRLENDARALLGSADDSVCTYPEGYAPRQMIYSCRTCSTDSNPAAICYGCSNQCHADHDVVELYTKRNVCCDCGNSKFNTKCKLFPEKKASNERNRYNHNYIGLYCVCNRHYPAEESDTTDGEEDGEMVQCIICEDWYHTNHVVSEGYVECEELVCGGCASRVSFLKYYADESLLPTDTKDGCTLKQLINKYTLLHKDNNSDKQTTTKDTLSDGAAEKKTTESSHENGLKEEEQMVKEEVKELGQKQLMKNELEKVEEGNVKEEKDDPISESAASKGSGKTVEKEENGKHEEACEKSGVKLEKQKLLMFESASWRERLCKCSDCMRLYDENDVAFLLDPDDSLASYTKSREAAKPSEEDEKKEVVESLISSLGRDGAINVLQGYELMKSKLMELIKRKSSEEGTVTAQDVRNAFSELRGESPRKQPRME